MPRRPREDRPGSWHHVINRGIARRPLFETRDDMRFFLARLARQVRAGRIEVHAYCLMTTHFHLLLSSPIGQISEAMRLVQNAYSRRFNRQHRRDGALIRGRFLSKPVRSYRYRRTLVGYIDANPVTARIVDAAQQYPFGSAAAYHRGAGPLWLSREWVEAEACAATGASRFTPAAYRAAFATNEPTAISDIEELVEARMTRSAADPFDDLIGMTPPGVQAWMKRKAMLADGHRPGLPVCGRRALRRALEENIEMQGVWRVEDDAQTRRGEELAWIGLARELCASTWQEVATSCHVSHSRARRLGVIYRRLLLTDRSFAERVAAIGHAAISRRESRRQTDPPPAGGD